MILGIEKVSDIDNALDGMSIEELEAIANDGIASPQGMELAEKTFKFTKTEAFIEGAKQGASYGFSDEIEAAVTNKPLSQLRADYAEARKEHPYATVGGEFAGATATTLAGGLALKAAVPGIMGGLKLAAAANPYKTATLAGGLQGALYGAGTGEGDEKERGYGALRGGLVGGAAGPALLAVGSNVIAPAAKGVGSLIGKGTKPEAVAPSILPAEFSSVTNKPLVETATTGKIRLPEGVSQKNVDLLRAEENARQGLLGAEAQKAIQAIDQNVDDDVRSVMQSLMGKETGDSRDILVKSIETFRGAGNAAKQKAITLSDIAEKAMAGTVFNKKKLGPSLGTALNDKVRDPSVAFKIKSKSGAEALGLYKSFLKMVRSKGNEIDYVDLAAWRQDVGDFRITDTPTSKWIAGQLAKTYDDWMSEMPDDVLLSGSKEAPALMRASKQAWRQFYQLFEPDTKIGGSAVLGGITKQFEKTPYQFIRGAFGETLKGNNDSLQIINGILKAVPEESQMRVKDSSFGGLMARAFEKSTALGSVSLPVLRNSLQEIVSGDVYKKALSTPERDAILGNVITEMTDYIVQRARPDIRSPSAGHMMRLLQSIERIPGAGLLMSISSKVAEGIGAAKERNILHLGLKEYANRFLETARMTKLIDALIPVEAGVVGGVAYGREKKQ